MPNHSLIKHSDSLFVQEDGKVAESLSVDDTHFVTVDVDDVVRHLS
jgi:hypothetical protein